MLAERPSPPLNRWTGLAAALVAWSMLGPVQASEPLAISVPTVVVIPDLQWPATLVRPDVHPQINAIEAAWASGDVAQAQALARQHAVTALRAADDQQRLDAQLALAMVLARSDAREAQRRFGQVADNAMQQGGLYAPHLLPARANEGFIALGRGDVQRAQEALVEALQLHRMHHGLHDPGQGVYLQALAALADGAGSDQVPVLLRRQMTLLQRQVGGDPAAAEQLVDRLPALIDTLRQSTAFAAMARPLRELRLGLADRVGDDDAVWIPLMIAEAHATAQYALATREPWDSHPLRRAHVTLTKDTTLSKEARALALIDVGNVWWLVGNRDAAMMAYRTAAVLKVPAADARLERAEVLWWPSGTPRALNDESADGRVELAVRVDAQGRVLRRDAVTIHPAEHPIGLARADAWRSALRRATVRPAVVDGRAVRRDDMVISDRFVPTS